MSTLAVDMLWGPLSDIRVESEVGKGSIFTVLLPMAKIPADIGNPSDRVG